LLAREDPLPLFMDKNQEKALAERMKDKYGMHKEACILNIARINSDSVKFAMQVIACKLLRKFCGD
jgi:hypothetical protein